MTEGEPSATPLLDKLARSHAHPRCDQCHGNGMQWRYLCDCVTRQPPVEAQTGAGRKEKAGRG